MEQTNNLSSNRVSFPPKVSQEKLTPEESAAKAKTSLLAISIIVAVGALTVFCMAGAVLLLPATPIIMAATLGGLPLLTSTIGFSIFHLANNKSTTGNQTSIDEEKNKEPSNQKDISREDSIGEWEIPKADNDKTEEEKSIDLENRKAQQEIEKGTRVERFTKQLLDERDIHDFVQTISSKNKNLIIELEYISPAGANLTGVFQDGKILNNKDGTRAMNAKALELTPDITIRPVGIAGEGKARYVSKRLAGKPVYSESHFAVFTVVHEKKDENGEIIRQARLEYFDPKNTLIGDQLIDKGTGMPITEIQDDLFMRLVNTDPSRATFRQYGRDENGSEYANEPQVQHWLDTKTCGVHCCRQIERVITNLNEPNPEPLKVLEPNSDDYQTLAKGYVDTINETIYPELEA